MTKPIKDFLKPVVNQVKRYIQTTCLSSNQSKNKDKEEVMFIQTTGLSGNQKKKREEVTFIQTTGVSGNQKQ